jgi:hypothetical protein
VAIINRQNVFWLFAAIVGVVGFLVVKHFLAVPTKCRCRIDNIPPELSEARLATNSIGDATGIHFGVGNWEEGERVRICYSAQPAAGTINDGIWAPMLPEKNCDPSQDFLLSLTQSQFQTDTEFATIYDLRIPGVSPENGDLLDRNWQSSGSLVSVRIDRQSGRCNISSSDWSGKYIEGQSDCFDYEFYLNPWYLWPQIVGLFHTRAFYWINAQE